MTDETLLSVRGLKKHYPITKGVLKREVGRVRAVDGVSFDVERGEVFGLVGESGCGKSTVAQTVLRLDEPTEGSVIFDGEDVTAYDETELRRFRRRAQVIFQDPDSSFDPRMSVGESVGEPLQVQGMHDRRRRRQIVSDLLERVGLSADDAHRYPHEFSGGQKQRIALARALSVNPDLIIADEPVSALDVSTKADILRLIADLQSEFGLSILLISHDISVVEHVCDRVAVMYLGELVEIGTIEDIFADPQHPYTEALLASVPTPDPRDRGGSIELTGDVPSPSDPPVGCRFHTRCPKVIQPPNVDIDQDAWRRIVDFRRRLETDGSDVAASVSSARDGDRGDSRPAIRDALDLPSSLDDPDAEAKLSTALEHLTRGDPDRTREVLDEAFSTPCRETPPETRTLPDGRRVSCHLLGDNAADR